ncbi:hypothetical protein X777_08291 [Ooceraea biroi]|uniref:Uncharacterized protein n=1 Tax=Ooceraea biroi TaxID=2015173 RepID=A0A026X120_OOCBI|nr:hypothetical protein X777_08291 [Ooceraea biroi]
MHADIAAVLMDQSADTRGCTKPSCIVQRPFFHADLPDSIAHVLPIGFLSTRQICSRSIVVSRRLFVTKSLKNRGSVLPTGISCLHRY